MLMYKKQTNLVLCGCACSLRARVCVGGMALECIHWEEGAFGV